MAHIDNLIRSMTHDNLCKTCQIEKAIFRDECASCSISSLNKFREESLNTKIFVGGDR